MKRNPQNGATGNCGESTKRNNNILPHHTRLIEKINLLKKNEEVTTTHHKKIRIIQRNEESRVFKE